MSPSHPTHAPSGRAQASPGAAPAIFLELSTDGSAASDPRSLTRRVAMGLAALVLLLSVSRYWATGASASTDGGDPAVIARSEGGEDGDESEREPDAEGDDGTNGETGTAADAETGAETREGVNTDAGPAAQQTGASTAGETDGADGTGASEQTQGTGAETRDGVNTDAPGNATGASTAGETDPGDQTGATEMR